MDVDIEQFGCDKQRLSLDAGSCKSPSMYLQHLSARVSGWQLQPPDVREVLRVSIKLCIFQIFHSCAWPDSDSSRGDDNDAFVFTVSVENLLCSNLSLLDLP